MDIQILGCSGGVGGSSGSTCIRLGQHILLDAGSGLERLSLEEMRAITHVVLSHAHLDHICALPTFLANLFGYTQTPIQVHALAETLAVLKKHIFNNQVWPDFTRIPTAEAPIMSFHEIQPEQEFTLGAYQFTPFSVVHTIPTVGFSVRKEKQHFVFTADTKLSPALIQRLNQFAPIDTLMIECSFPDHYHALAENSGHLTPASLKQVLQAQVQAPKQVWITHLKPSYEAELRQQLANDPACQHWHVLSP